MLVYLRDGFAWAQLYILPHWESGRAHFCLTQSQYTDTGPTSPSTGPIMLASGRAATGVPFFKSLVWLNQKNPHGESGNQTPGSAALEAEALSTRPTSQSAGWKSCLWRRWWGVQIHWLIVSSGHFCLLEGAGGSMTHWMSFAGRKGEVR